MNIYQSFAVGWWEPSGSLVEVGGWLDVSGNKTSGSWAELNGFSGASVFFIFRPKTEKRTTTTEQFAVHALLQKCPDLIFRQRQSGVSLEMDPAPTAGWTLEHICYFRKKGHFLVGVMKCGCVRLPRSGKHYCENICRGRKLSRKWFVLANVCFFELNGNSLWFLNRVQKIISLGFFQSFLLFKRHTSNLRGISRRFQICQNWDQKVQL